MHISSLHRHAALHINYGNDVAMNFMEIVLHSQFRDKPPKRMINQHPEPGRRLFPATDREYTANEVAFTLLPSARQRPMRLTSSSYTLSIRSLQSKWCLRKRDTHRIDRKDGREMTEVLLHTYSRRHFWKWLVYGKSPWNLIEIWIWNGMENGHRSAQTTHFSIGDFRVFVLAS